MSALWTSDDAVKATGGTVTAPFQVDGVSIDTRTLGKGDLFVALDGDNSDGHAYVLNAFERGAAAALVSRPTDEMRAAGPLLVVEDTLKGLEALGRAARARSHAKIIAVTGSVGKTGTKEALRHVLSAQGKTHASAASYNNHWGVPLSLARMAADTEYAVFEIGMNHAGEITPLSKMVQPDVAIITTVEPVHLKFFSSVEEIADAKAEIFAGLKGGGVAVLNRDNPHFERLKAAAERVALVKILSFGMSAEADIRAEKAVLHENCSCVSASVDGEGATFKISVPGQHIVMNSLAVLGAVKAAGADLARALLKLADLTPPAGRGERHHIKAGAHDFLLIDESYNANPASMRAALAALGQASPRGQGRRIAVLGDMLELGPRSDELHAGLASALEEAGAAQLYACGPHMKALCNAAPARIDVFHGETSDDLIKPLLRQLRAGDCVMVKGSLGSKMARVVEALKALGDEDAEEAQRGRA
ncbi:UDP-N-acetylmuramoylalanyl-D-glutamyl-2,6-diaminopimelate--D-alanyl-D-alanine ligase [Tepidicaulis sp. LMO-SS28]|uniref:UDP-N-acetylmuramoylalanyl-D-glutamyl-2, 6-diaminopimelate--D-alanyl-D-alanine ligase n=1 Tax=Tepidicaulis sp. LMO-SS28 TaxID=3447455 RepID=UPI003EE15A61